MDFPGVLVDDKRLGNGLLDREVAPRPQIEILNLNQDLEAHKFSHDVHDTCLAKGRDGIRHLAEHVS